MNGKENHDDLSGRQKYSHSKKNIKGFTLVELLAVITIMTILIIVAIPSTMSISKRLKTNLYCEKIELIQTAAELYGEDRSDSLTTDIAIDDKTYLGKKIQVKDLITTNYLKKDQTDYPYILDPRDKTSDSLYNLELFIYKKNNRIYIAFDNIVNGTCNIEENSIDFSKYETENEEINHDAQYTAPTSKNLTYNGSAQALINAGSSSTGTMYYKVGDSGTYSTEIPTATNAGPYTVYYKVTSTVPNYNDLEEQSISVTIIKASAKYTAPTSKNLTYNGSAQALINAGSSSTGTIQYKLGDSGTYSTEIPKATNAGPYTVYYRVISTNSNYSNLSEQSISVTINKTSATYTAPTAKSLTYTGSAQALINPGSSSVGKMYYKLGSDGEYQESIPTATNAGTYTVYYKVASTNSNYNDLSEKSISVTINKASATYTAPTNKNLTYNGSNQSLLNAGSSGVGTLYYHLSTSSSWSTSVPTATNAGTYIVVYKVVSTNSNYSSSSEQSISVTINKASAKYTAPTSKNLTYNGSAQALINAGSSSIGTIQYKLGASGTYSTSVPAATNAGTYTVYYKVTSTNSNYNDLSEKYVSVTISGLNLISKITTLAKSDTTNFAYDGTSDNNLRYIGSNPSNYVCFNSSCSNGKWRIIGIMNNIKTATHGTQSLVKIIRADFVGFYDWDSNSGNNWSSASLQTSLNSGELYTTYIKSYASLFETVTWNLGGTATYISSSNGLARHFYSYERGTTVYSGRPTTWSGKIGLIYPSDYGFATSGGSTTNRAACLAKELYNWNDSSVSDCRNNNYLSQSTGWTLTPYSENSKGVFTISSIVIDFDASGFSFSARPVGYLISNAKILSGNGTSSSPWVIGT